METRSAVVTGAGSGLGFATAKMLKEQGWTVFGTIIEGQSDAELKKLGITPLVVDISNPDEVYKIAETVDKIRGDKGISALLNIAGISGPGGGLLEGVPMEGIRVTMDVNVIGTLNMVRAFLPLLRKYGKGRIVNVSAGCRTPAPFTGAYLVSKYAVEGITNVLRYEQAPFGIQVTSIEPAGIKTAMIANHEENEKKTWDRMGDKIKAVYYDKIEPTLQFINKSMGKADEPSEVSKVIIKALNAKKMKIRYMAKSVSWQAGVQRLIGENAFESMMQKGMKLK